MKMMGYEERLTGACSAKHKHKQSCIDDVWKYLESGKFDSDDKRGSGWVTRVIQQLPSIILRVNVPALAFEWLAPISMSFRYGQDMPNTTTPPM